MFKKTFLTGFLVNIIFICSCYASPPFIVGKALGPWQPGYLDIYHINEGLGNSTFMIFPDGTTLLYDLGDAIHDDDNQNKIVRSYSSLLPSTSQTAYESVGNFIKNFSPHPNTLNYFVLSHYHFDHLGEWSPNRKIQPQGNYILSGITGLAEEIHVQNIIDRSYPNYSHHGDVSRDLNTYKSSSNLYAKLLFLTMRNYQKFITYQKEYHHLNPERFAVGSNKQIHLLYHAYPNFEVRNIIGNGYVWTGKDKNTYHFIQYTDFNSTKKENDLSCGFRIDYGTFRYFTGGDITGKSLSGNDIATSAEAVSAPVVGKVDVATMNHHGFDDAESNIWVSTLRPSVWIQQNWAASQVSLPLLLRITDKHNYDYSRGLFSLNHFKLNDLAFPTLGPASQDALNNYYKSRSGHVVIRVMPGGKQFWVIVLTDNTTHPVIKAFFGPYQSMKK